MSPREKVQSQMQEELLKARSVAVKAEGEGRQLNSSEQAAIKAHFEKISSFEKKLHEIDGDDAMLKRLNDLIGVPGSSSGADHRGSGLKVRGRLNPSGFKSIPMNGPFSGAKDILSTGSLVVSTPILTALEVTEPAATIAELFPVATPNEGSDRFRFTQLVSKDMNAGPVAPGGLKPTSTLLYESIDDRTRVYAHLSEPIDRFLIQDNSKFATVVESEFRNGLLSALDADIILGDGTGEHFVGILETDGHLAQPFVTNVLTTTRKALSQLETTGVKPTSWLFSVADWEAIELTQAVNGTPFVMGQQLPVDVAQRRLWGIPVTVSPTVPVGTAVLLDTQAFVLVERSGIEVDINSTGGDLFDRNQVKLRVEGRYGLAAVKPSSAVEVDLAA